VQLVQASRSELLAVAQAVRFNTPEKVKLNSPVSAVLKSYFDNTLFVVFALSKIKANFRNKYQCLKINRCLLCACLQCLEDHSECASATGVFHPSANVNSKIITFERRVLLQMSRLTSCPCTKRSHDKWCRLHCRKMQQQPFSRRC